MEPPQKKRKTEMPLLEKSDKILRTLAVDLSSFLDTRCDTFNMGLTVSQGLCPNWHDSFAKSVQGGRMRCFYLLREPIPYAQEFLALAQQRFPMPDNFLTSFQLYTPAAPFDGDIHPRDAYILLPGKRIQDVQKSVGHEDYAQFTCYLSRAVLGTWSVANSCVDPKKKPALIAELYERCFSVRGLPELVASYTTDPEWGLYH